MSTRLQKMLARVRRDSELSQADKKHLDRWASYGDDIPWEKIETDAEKHGLHPTGAACETVVRYSLMNRSIAEDAQSGSDRLFEERKRQRDLLLALADKAEALAGYYSDAEKFSGIAMFFQRFLKPVSELQDLHKQEAVLLRQRAGREPTPTTFISRQKRGIRRRHSRKYSAFMFLMADHMREICGKPHYDAVSDITNIAFLEADVTADDVRNACRSPIRRRRSTRTPK